LAIKKKILINVWKGHIYGLTMEVSIEFVTISKQGLCTFQWYKALLHCRHEKNILTTLFGLS
jgi:hypothetical protein